MHEWEALLDGTTPGPWVRLVDGDVLEIRAEATYRRSRYPITDVIGEQPNYDLAEGPERGTMERNARLAAAAPDLAATVIAQAEQIRRLQEGLREIEGWGINAVVPLTGVGIINPADMEEQQ